MQRQEKLDKKEPENFSEEFADIIITTLLLATSVDVNIEEAILKKMEKINQRNNTEQVS